VASTIHAGTYGTLSEAYAALEVWIESHGLQSAGAPWEEYITDPAEHPDPKDWRTEVFWPVRTV
jgi:effector-binding domain-containing protein